MPDNLYLDQPEAGGGLGDLALLAGLTVGSMWTSHGLISPERMAIGAYGIHPAGRARGQHALEAAVKYKRRWAISRWRQESRALSKLSGTAWKGLLQPGLGWSFGRRFAATRIALRALPGLERGVSASFAAKALLRGPVAVGMAYYGVGFLLPMAAEGLVGGFNELARLGMNLRRAEPETSVGYRDMATRERAFTMRQASLMAIHTSQLGVRAALGDEASYLHA